MATPSPTSSASTSPPLPSSSPPPPSDAPPPSSPPPPDSTPPPSPSLPVADSPPPPPDSSPPPPSPDPPSTPGSNSPPVAQEPPLAPPTPSSFSPPPPGDFSPSSPSPPPPSGEFSPPSSYPPPPSGEFSPPSSYPPPPPHKKHLSPPPPSTVISPSPSNSSLGSPTTPFTQKVPSPPNPSNNLSPPGTSITYTPNSSGSSGEVNPSMAAGIGAAAAVAVLFLAMLIWCMRRRKKYDGGYPGEYRNPSPIPSSQVSGTSTPFRKDPSVPFMVPNSTNQVHTYPPADNGMGNSKSWFTYEELAQATNGFSFQNLLGEGGFGCVYKGFLSDGREVAVKQLKVGGSQGEREFQAEVEIISRVHHRHLVSLVGYCILENQRLLVYDFVPNDTLYYHLHGKGRSVMDWPTRVKVAAGAARGLAYLHEDCHPRIIHRDIKSSNILLDSNFEAQVADFGLAKLTEDTNTHVTTRVMGTFGYLAPEYASSGKLTDRSDVFSFGVVLLELITGRRPVDSSQPLGEESLVEWARPLMITALETGIFDKLPDPRLENNYNEAEMFRIIEAASACVRYNAQMRPRMGRVMRALDNIADSMDINNGVKPGQTQVFNGPTNPQDMKNFHKMAFGSQDYSSDFSKSSYL